MPLPLTATNNIQRNVGNWMSYTELENLNKQWFFRNLSPDEEIKLEHSLIEEYSDKAIDPKKNSGDRCMGFSKVCCAIED